MDAPRNDTPSPARSATYKPLAGDRYTPEAQILHWVTAVLMFVVLPLAWVGVSLPDNAPSRETIFDLHKSVGVTILALVAVRLAWRATHPAPALSAHAALWQRRLAFASHWLLYLILAGMPLSGYVMSASGGHPVSYFGLFTLPALPKNEALSHAGQWLHVATGQWLVYALILLHLAATAWHVAVRRDGTLERMIPPQREGA